MAIQFSAFDTQLLVKIPKFPICNNEPASVTEVKRIKLYARNS